MKYSVNNKPLVCMQTQNPCYVNTYKMEVQGILWHSTGANNPTIKRYVQPSDVTPPEDTYSKAKWLEVMGTNKYNNDFNHSTREVGLNSFIGKLADGTVTTVQTMPWDYRPWGCGKGTNGSCNNGWIQFEICEDDLTDPVYFEKAYTEACELTAYLCKMFNIDPKGTTVNNGTKAPTITCHGDAHKLGLASNHGDINHWFPKYGKSMETVREDVAKILKEDAELEEKAKQEAEKAEAKTYEVVTPINKYASSGDAAAQKNSKGTLAKGIYYIYNKYPNGVNGMFNLNTDPDSAGSWINPKENVIKESAPATETVKKLYRVRKSADDSKSQKGAYSDLANAKACCQSAGEGYHVFDENFNIVYSYEAPAPVVTLIGIEVSAQPNKIEYQVGESFDSTGLKVTAIYSDESSKIITDYKLSDFSLDVPGAVLINVTFEDKTATFAITVLEKEEEIIPEPEVIVAVYDLDYPEKHEIINRKQIRTEVDCCKAIKKILSNNESFDIEIAKAFFELAPKYDIDPMIAISQSILETGWFKYKGSAVTADQHNYCGLGVTSNGVTGAAFVTIAEGITAQLQHLFAYGCTEALPDDELIVDPRFTYVTRGIAPYWQQLAGRWACPGYDKSKYGTPAEAMAAENTYGQKIIKIFKSIEEVIIDEEDLNKYFNKQPEIEEQPEVEEPIVEPVEPEVEPTPVEPDITPEVTPEDAPMTEEELQDQKAESIADFILKILKKIIQKIASWFSDK